MDLNIVALSGRLAAEPERREFASGSRLLRLLVAVRHSAPHRRVDVLPVAYWDPPQALWDADMEPGMWAWVSGSVQRRFWAGEEGRRSRLELLAVTVQVRPTEEFTGQPISS
ncbi:MAG: single-stranded DNA-binding protein [Acidimicrobiia bacterium]|nr:single-stranded DNA-binding protein [Acidimicrobiia bacterium]